MIAIPCNFDLQTAGDKSNGQRFVGGKLEGCSVSSVSVNPVNKIVLENKRLYMIPGLC